jgi:hypothetical protein
VNGVPIDIVDSGVCYVVHSQNGIEVFQIFFDEFGYLLYKFPVRPLC